MDPLNETERVEAARVVTALLQRVPDINCLTVRSLLMSGGSVEGPEDDLDAPQRNGGGLLLRLLACPDQATQIVQDCIQDYKKSVEAQFAQQGGLCPLVRALRPPEFLRSFHFLLRILIGCNSVVFLTRPDCMLQCWQASTTHSPASIPAQEANIKATVIGYGMAGRARTRDLEQLLATHFEFQGVVSRRAVAEQQLARVEGGWDALMSLSHPNGNKTHAIVICSENALHYQQAKEALMHGYNVAVEYPPALSLSEWQELLQLAHTNDLILHVEWMALYSAGQKLLKLKLEGMRSLVSARVSLTSGWEPTPITAPFAAIGSPAFAGISRLVRILDLFGDVKVAAASLTLWRDESRLGVECIGFTLTSELISQTSGATITWVEERKAGAKRKTSVYAQDASGDKIYEEPTGSGWQPYSLFTYDSALFAHEILRSGPALDILRRNHDFSSKAIILAEIIDSIALPTLAASSANKDATIETSST